MNEPDTRIDYASLHDDYWSQPGRFAGHSRDARPVVAELLRACGNGRILDVGCGSGQLVRTLLDNGADASGVDVSAVAVEHCSRLAPGRFQRASALDLPFADASFDVVVSVDCLQHLSAADVPAALRELYRVARHSLYLRLSTAADPEGRWHLTVAPRDWWEQQLFAAGFRRHPRAMAITPYELLEREPPQIVCVMEKIEPAVAAAHPLERLLLTRDLHMDMLRESGRRADAHVARYHLAAPYVRPNDVVLDVACGLGYGSAVLAANSAAARVIGVDLGDDAVAYARAVTGSRWPQTEFHAGDACALAFLADDSVDFVTSFETLEHLPDPVAFLREVARVLKPSGRIVVSVPNQWVDETGRDPNPHHLHVYDWGRLHAELAAQFLPETVWSQTAGGGMKLSDADRRIQRCPLDAAEATPAEWWLAMAMRTPLAMPADGYRETSFPTRGTPSVVAFARDYGNPWLVKAMVSRGHRMTDGVALQRLAERALAESPADSADAGAALCVLAYRTLEDPAATADAVDALLRRVESYAALHPANPNVLRWQVSLLFVAARLQLWCGRRQQANALFARCAALDVKAYSPILGTKTVDALLRAGTLAAVDGDEAAAKQCWTRAIEETQRLFQGSWDDFLGDASQPVAFGLVEAAEVLDLAAHAANELAQSPMRAQRPGFSHEAGSARMRHRVLQLETALRENQKWAQQLLLDLKTTERALRDALATRHTELDGLHQQLQRALARSQELTRENGELRLRAGVRGTLRALWQRLRRR